MQTSFGLDVFIRKSVTHRDESLLNADFQRYNIEMQKRINGKSVKRSIQEIDIIFDQLNNLFKSQETTKISIFEIYKEYLPSFKHLETGKGLDSKM